MEVWLRLNKECTLESLSTSQHNRCIILFQALAAAITFLERVRSTENGAADPETSDSTRAKTRYAALLAAALSPRAPTALVQGALLALLEVLACAGGALAPAERAALGAAVEPLVAHPDPSSRRRAARALCLLGDDVGADRRRRWAQVALAPGSRLEERLGAVEALGCASCWAALRRGEPCEEEDALRTCALDDASDAQCAAIFWLSLLARARAASGESWFHTQAATLVSGLAKRLERPGVSLRDVCLSECAGLDCVCCGRSQNVVESKDQSHICSVLPPMRLYLLRPSCANTPSPLHFRAEQRLWWRWVL